MQTQQPKQARASGIAFLAAGLAFSAAALVGRQFAFAGVAVAFIARETPIQPAQHP